MACACDTYSATFGGHLFGTANLGRDILSEYITAARAYGASDVRLVWRHIVPNAIQPVIANSALQMAGAVVLEASLSFLGLGDPNLISWGRMLQTAQSYY